MINLIIGLLAVGSSIPLALRKVPMNFFLSVKISKAYASDENWYAINAYGGKWFIGIGSILAAIGALTLIIDIQQEWLLKALVFAPLLLLIAYIRTWLYSRTL